MVGDPLGDFVVRLKNAALVRHTEVSAPYSKLKHAVADVLHEAGFVGAVEKRGKKVRKTLRVELSYKDDGTPRITHTRRISSPGRRVYKAANEIHAVRYGRGALVLSTPKGIMTDAQARKENIGGEALFEIW